MPTPPISRSEAERRISAINDALRAGYRPPGVYGNGPGAVCVAAEALGLREGSSLTKGLKKIWQDHQIAPDWSLYRPAAAIAPPPPPKMEIPVGPPPAPIEPAPRHEFDLIGALRKHPLTLEEIAGKAGVTRGAALDMLDALKAEGINLQQFGDRWSVEKMQEPAYASGGSTIFTSEPDNTYRFGVMADSHLGSKYARLDALNDCYDQFAEAGITRVYHCGNWIEGEAQFNRTELTVHGMDAQLEFLAREYPQRPGITTYAVAGDDHEGWYGRREGVDIGRRAEQTMRESGRKDWINLGFMEAHVKLVNANTGKDATLAVCHPGGGSSYAISYVVQKIIESVDGGEKPAVWLGGHYHKSGYFVYRNVHCVLVPSTKDQDIFMRKKRISSIVGGGIVTLRQDPETGAIPRCLPDLWQYYNRGYYNDRWSHSGEVVLPDRSIAP